MAKLYPFSVQKHAHDIEFRKNRVWNTLRDMESGEVPWDHLLRRSLRCIHLHRCLPHCCT